ncbi:SDR family NAD(P)-dependent oxidoreductase [Celeribacter indicus]|uniref:Bacilysin biosynthesis oxidoreductase BacC n=1 Tax=Celeribacter indicus TaxID=1208324 RepID=A0A0B5DXI8_9RHOB|nr:SDR family NAD(P)-dependent oxidoreductase [Celeribacter indicus]AJE47699.1 bacilysin biosynthesis oxidoreductase BacC [Celeribacter indicus]SDW14608.1 dihydroanticapsin dehydrogenase [Celeribacter indicus]
MTDRLSGKKAIVTGAAQGIGFAVADAFVREGAQVVILDLNGDLASEAAGKIGARCTGLQMDVSDEASVKQGIAAALEVLGGLDIVVNNAGVQRASSIEEASVEDWDLQMSVNMRGPFLVLREALPHLSAGASVINTSSAAGLRGAPGVSGYCASKGGQILFTTAAAAELGPRGIRVNAVCPGWVDTPFNGPVIRQMGGTEAHDAMIRATVPLGRQATPPEIAPTYVFLASDEASYLTGKAIGVDGGVV